MSLTRKDKILLLKIRHYKLQAPCEQLLSPINVDMNAHINVENIIDN